MKHAWPNSALLQALKGETLSSGFSTDRSLKSEFAAPHSSEEQEVALLHTQKKATVSIDGFTSEQGPL